MNILVITLGTRDVQLKLPSSNNNFELQTEITLKPDRKFEKTYITSVSGEKVLVYRDKTSKPDMYYLSEARRGGEQLLNPVWQPLICYPLIQPVVAYLQQIECEPQHIFIVYTDQEGYAERNFTEKDTKYFSELVWDYLQQQYPNATLDAYGVCEDAVNIDFQYDKFHTELKTRQILEFSLEQIDNVWLLPQGGIDQVNQALTLALIETYKGKLKQLQTLENATVRLSNFPERFVDRLLRNQLLKQVERYEYSLAYSVVQDSGLSLKGLSTLLNLGSSLLNANWRVVELHIQEIRVNFNEMPNELYAMLSLTEQFTTLQRLQFVFLNALIKYHNQQFEEMLWRIYSIAEILHTPVIESFLNCKIQSGDDYRSFRYAVKKHREGDLLDYLRSKIKGFDIYRMKPNYSTLNNIAAFMRLNPELNSAFIKKWEFVNRVAGVPQALSKKRNFLFHNGEGLSEDDINQALPQNKPLDKMLLELYNHLFKLNETELPRNLPLIQPLHKLILERIMDTDNN